MQRNVNVEFGMFGFRLLVFRRRQGLLQEIGFIGRIEGWKGGGWSESGFSG